MANAAAAAAAAATYIERVYTRGAPYYTYTSRTRRTQSFAPANHARTCLRAEQLSGSRERASFLSRHSLSLSPPFFFFSSSSRAFRSFQPRKRLSRGWGEGRGRLGSIGSIRNGEDQREGEFRRELSLRRVLIAEEKRRDGR